MRRFTAVFKRDKSDSHQPSSPRSHPLPTQSFKKHLKLPLNLSFTSSSPVRTPSSITSTPQLSSASEHGQSSGCSSGSASVSLPTQEEDSQATSLARSGTRRSWKDWLGGKRSEPVKMSKPTEWDRPVPVWNERLPTLQDPQANRRRVREVDDTDEGSSSEFDDEGSVSLSEHPRPVAKGTASLVKARQNLELLIKNSLVPPLPSSPFVQHSSTYIFPRSCNRPRGLSPALDIRRSVLNRRLLRRLEGLSADDEMTILPFGLIRTPNMIRSPTLPDHNAVRSPNTTQIFSASPGLRRWISRPCFEDRFAVFLPSKDSVHRCPVIGTLAVAALEYSEFLDVMVDPDFDPSSPPPDMMDDAPWTPAFDHPSSNISPLSTVSNDPLGSPSSINPRHSYVPSPSPLRNQHSPEMSSSQPAPQTAPPALISPLSSPTSPPSSQSNASPPPSPALLQPSPVSLSPQSPIGAPVKRVVRFVEDDNDDTVPLHLLRQKKKREEKTKFLRTEQRRRLMEQEQERRRLEAEEIEKERRRLAIERERKEAERCLYAEEVVAARLRRESQRAGIVPGIKSDASNPLVPSPSAPSLRETERNRPRESRRYSLMPHCTGSSSSIPRREASESALQTASHSYPHETSGYRASSGGHSPVGSSGHGHPSRPGSMYSTSSEDGRPSSKRYSAVVSIPVSLTRPFAERTSSSAWSGSNQSLLSQPIPPVPPIPDFVNDLVLLPPSAPFMMYQYPRQSRHSSPGPSNSSGSLRGNSASSSSERVNMQRHSFRPTETYSAPPSAGASPSRTESRSSHSRHGSGDSRRSSMPVSPQSFIPRSQPSSLSRGRSQMSHSQTTLGTQYLQPPSPWTALPTQHGTLPTTMPVPTYFHSTGLNTLSMVPSSRGSTRREGGTKRQTIV